MIAKNEKKTILSGVLLIVSTVCYALYQILLKSYFVNYYGITDDMFSIAWENILFTAICAVILILYCCILHKTVAGKVSYLIGFIAFSLLHIYLIISASSRFDLYVFSDIIFVAISVLMIFTKMKNNKGISTAGIILFIIYAITQFIAVINDLFNSIRIGGIVWVFFYIYLIADYVAFFNLWLIEDGNLAFKKNKPKQTHTPMENDLIAIKQLYENGTITEQEYIKRKNEILNNL